MKNKILLKGKTIPEKKGEEAEMTESDSEDEEEDEEIQNDDTELKKEKKVKRKIKIAPGLSKIIFLSTYRSKGIDGNEFKQKSLTS